MKADAPAVLRPDGGRPARSGEVGGDSLPPVEPGRAARPVPAERRKPTVPEGGGGGSSIPRASGRAITRTSSGGTSIDTSRRPAARERGTLAQDREGNPARDRD
ncbi:hypothetical protein [Methanosphaerula subterraneus]|uniref:hypothetical protein n=1 Tax=Methanosphaerula subterraneus TaxID=3350244 RepID=UPI003F8374CE